MKRKSKIIAKLKEEEIQRFKRMSPQQRISLAITHSNLIRSIFGTGLKLKGFSTEEIDSVWNRKDE